MQPQTRTGLLEPRAKPPEVIELEKQRSDYMDEVRKLMKKNREIKSKTFQPVRNTSVDAPKRREVIELEKQRSDYMDEVRAMMKQNRIKKAQTM